MMLQACEHDLAQAFPMDLDEIARAIDIPLSDWPGSCHAVALAVLRRLPVAGMRLTRGHWHGPISRSSVFGNRGFTQHSWLVLEDGRVLDPTRWTITDPGRPCLYLGVNDHYDEAGLQLAQARPPSFFNMGKNPYVGLLEGRPDQVLATLGELLGLSADSDIRRTADRLKSCLVDAPEQLSNARGLYALLADMGLKSLIRIDLWNLVMAPETITHRGANMLYRLPPAETVTPLMLFFRLMAHFVSVEKRDLRLEDELEEIGYTLDDLHDAINQLERLLKTSPSISVQVCPRSYLDTLCVIAGDILGKGFGVALEVERYAASLGYDRQALDQALAEIGQRCGYDLRWM